MKSLRASPSDGRNVAISSIVGLTAAVGLFLFYSLTMRLLAGSWGAAWWQFRQLWFLMTPLIAGFGAQVGLFYYLKSLDKNAAGKGMMAAGSATSTLSMVACCAHHLTDVVPILGLSALSLWLVSFQKPLLILGIFSNLAGSLYLWKKLSRKERR